MVLINKIFSFTKFNINNDDHYYSMKCLLYVEKNCFDWSKTCIEVYLHILNNKNIDQ